MKPKITYSYLFGQTCIIFSLAFILIGLLLGLVQLILAKEQDQEKLIKMVVLSRHGLRSPILPHSDLEEWTQKKWPYWSVKNGYLTQRGGILISELWEELRDDPWIKELFPQNICPNPELIYVRSNTMERTQVTAIAILNGLAPGCGLNYFVSDSIGKDPLFNSIEIGKGSINLSKALQEFYHQYNGVQEIQKGLEESLGVIVDVLGPCPEETCKKYGLLSECTILDIPSTIVLNKKNKKLQIIGGLRFASVTAECLLLLQGEWPKGNLSNLAISQEQLKKIYFVHSTVSNSINRLSEMAVARGSSLLKAITDALTSSDSNTKINKAKLVIFSGHEGNIQSVAGMLDLKWKIDDYPPNATPPGGMLVFTLWETPKGNTVKIFYICQALETIISPIGYPQKIFKEQVYIGPRISSQPVVNDALSICSENQFKNWVDSVIDKSWIDNSSKPLKSKNVF